jgi:DUF1680 family protein
MNRHPITIRNISIHDPLWSKRIDIARNISINYMWNALNDKIPGVPPSCSIRNMKIAAGLEVGEYKGRPFQDSDLYKWIEAASYSLMTEDDSSLRSKIDEAVSLIEQVQRSDGYINTYIMLTGTPRWSNLASLHELYCGGHLMEAAVAYQDATGSKRLVNVACKFADLVDSIFGPEPEKKHGYPGHQEIEIGLYKLYKTTGVKRYLYLAKYFLDERGKKPFYFDLEQEERIRRGEPPLNYFQDHGPMRFSYQQAHLPVREQKIATGHAVREVYMCTALADIGNECDDSLLESAKRLYDNIINTQMYVIGAIGSMVDGEALTIPYDIPNDRMYTETCASVGLMMASQRLLNSQGSGRYADVIERALYNTILASVSEDGTKYFYTNPMEMWPERSRKRNDMKDIFPERQGWYVCACCPPNILRTLMSLGQYIYSADDNGIYVNLYIGSTVSLTMNASDTGKGQKVILEQESSYTQNGKVQFSVHCSKPMNFTLGLHIPYWCQRFSVKVNNESVQAEEKVRDGFLYLKRTFSDGDSIQILFEKEPVYIYSDDRVPYNAGKVAVQDGPFIYCTEQIDNGNELWNLRVDTSSDPVEIKINSLPKDLKAIEAAGVREEERNSDGNLYGLNKPNHKKVKIYFTPYFYWGNRRPGEEMNIWHLFQ